MMVSFSPRVSNAAPGAITNPLKATSLVGLLDAFVQILVTFGIPIAAVAIIYSGFLFVTARGNEQKVTKAKEAFYWAIIGSVILLGARVIIGVVSGTISAIK